MEELFFLFYLTHEILAAHYGDWKMKKIINYGDWKINK